MTAPTCWNLYPTKNPKANHLSNQLSERSQVMDKLRLHQLKVGRLLLYYTSFVTKGQNVYKKIGHK